MKKATKKKIQSAYKALSVIVTNTGLLFLLLNLFLFVPSIMRDAEVKTKQAAANLERVRPRPGQPLFTKKRNGHQMKWTDLRSYENIEPANVNQVLDDFYDLTQKGYAFHPYTHFTEPTFSSPTLNIQKDDDGFISRVTPRKKNAKYPYRIFMFGGSTTFGWHVADDQTIPYYLENAIQRKLRKRRIWRQVEVTNFGKGYHSWFQEMILFERLLHAGKVPNAVVFMDGVNVLHADSPHETPYWTDKFTELWDQAQLSTTSLPGAFPIFRVMNYFRRQHFRQWFSEFNDHRHPTKRTFARPDWVERTRKSYFDTIQQIEALAALHKIKTYFVWQPNRAYDCQSEKYSTQLPSHYVNKMVPLYTQMKREKRKNFHFAGNLCRRYGFDKRIIIDDVHYSPEFNKYVANNIASLVRIRKRN